MRKLLLALLGGAVAATAAQAITYGQADGNRHPMVGTLVGTIDGETRPYCSGTLISPTVFLTAAHCALETNNVMVTFAEQYSAGVKLYSGTFYGNPAYSQAQSDSQDLAVVVFAQPISAITPAQLPTAGLLDTMKADKSLRQTKFTSVGYGGQEVPNGKPELTYLDAREYAVGSFSALGPGYLRLSQNQATGNGGTCFGDSGGPAFFGAGASETTTLAGVISTGDTWCKSTNVLQRIDNEAARDFLGGFVTLP